MAGIATGLAFFGAAFFLAAFLAAGFFAAFLAAGFLATFLAAFLAAGFLATFFAAFLAAGFLATFFAAFLAAGFFATFFAAFLAGFFATFLAAFLAAGFLATFFFATFFAAGFLATFFAAFLAAGFLAAFFAAFLTAMVWLLVNGYFGKAQFQKTPRVSDPRATADAPGAPVGWGGDTAIHCRAVVDVPHPIKNPRRLSLQVSIMGASLFREGCDAGVHRLMLRVEVRVMLPVIAFCFLTRFCRERLLGRNLITVFATVNNLSQIFFAAPTSRSRLASTQRLAHIAMRMHADARVRACKCKNAGKNATFFDASHSRMHAFASHRALPIARAGVREQARDGTPATAHPASPLRVAQARLRKTARTFSVRADRPRALKRKNPRRWPRVSMAHAGVQEGFSVLRLPAARRSRPG